jgi:hypothetical protein
VLEDCHKRSCWKNSIGVGWCSETVRVGRVTCVCSSLCSVLIDFWSEIKFHREIEPPEFVTVGRKSIPPTRSK